ncbi:SDR family NAD(P)-dependent oxidoreductase [Novosphingobium sp. ST904]|uniref:SDR family NAD(P)-dependent oxidoreductase n=1 Tax=Novosphingobium sp. ST904 TaxID=1684385 RepID=UPI0006C8E073|nr:SDR family NAD(P)-dependent oxidoreductase [Novosphingobium sp. ST904]KPH66071.1 alcohol dehydrogenase [Novosphingobium sp. ST904]TCM27746.1 2-hydroxycyclohexanecarboxyl-CoA dehydrogenase [Novosphingobium sp. ST904]
MTNKTALVTGAASGIGKACAKRLARDGMAVGVVDILLDDAQRTADEINAEGGRAIAVQASIADRGQVAAAVSRIRKEFGPITVLVNNAGITDTTPFLDVTDELWERIYEVNVKGTFIMTQVVLPDMIAAGWGRIVNMSSSSAQTGSALMAPYSSSKGAIITLTRTLAAELGPLGITVNNIPPGVVMNTVMSEANKEKFPIPLETVRSMIPVRRTGEPDDIANACSWLCLEATGYVTGQTIGVNGGRIPS